ncbi:MAG: sodium/proton-translocating pyrophosphatase, partial [Candidatus Omnitrophica bacterium]|nr:sodium/proton-translocating pyrophosphatase [Candidatus Omnitrophota bacterium]
MQLVILTGIGSLAALIFAGILTANILQKSEGTDKMKEIAQHIRDGANAYLKRQYMGVGLFFAVAVAILSVMAHFGYLTWFVPFAFLSGGFFSGLAGFIGMRVATSSNARTAWAAKQSLNSG